MKTKKLVLALAMISLMLVLSDGARHFFKAKSAKNLLTIMTSKDSGFDSVNETMNEHYWSVGEAAVSAAALGFLMFIVARTKYAHAA
jgi:hypothetical protein